MWIIPDSSWSWLSVNLFFNSEKLGLYPRTFIYLIIQFQYIGIAVSELLTYTAWATTLPARVQCWAVVSFAFSLTNYTHFQSYLDQHLSPTPFSEVVSYMCNTVRFSFHGLDSFLGSPDIPKRIFFLNLHTPVFTVCVVQLQVLTNAIYPPL